MESLDHGDGGSLGVRWRSGTRRRADERLGGGHGHRIGWTDGGIGLPLIAFVVGVGVVIWSLDGKR
jgi:hypothetical protein